MSIRIHRRWLGGLATIALLALVLPVLVSAHSELKSSDPADGATVPSPFSGPVALTFTEHLADGTNADLIAPDGSTVAAASVGADPATMTFTLTSALAPGAYQAKWTSIADDGDLLRGIVKFTVAAAATAEPATPAPSAAGNNSGGGNDVILPIIIVLIIITAGALYLLRRNRAA